jgi:peptidyl-prolyl cis-trans isomerase SurA
MKFKNFLILFSAILLWAGNTRAQDSLADNGKVLDKIVAVVDNEMILQSELDYQVKLEAAQKKIDPNTPGLENQVLNSMIEQKLAYAQAILDSINVTDDEVNDRINQQIQYFEQQYGSEQKVEQIYGMSIEKIKRKLQDPVRKNLMINKLEQKKFGDVDASRKEVEKFFDTYKDSIGVIPEKVDIAHIFMVPKLSEKAKEKYKAKAEAILDSLRHGADFAEMAKKYSEDPGSASEGGDLGWVGKGAFYPEFEAAAFALKPGQISNVVETPVGYHIIQLLGKRGDKIHTRHILIKFKKGEQADLNTIEFLSNLRDSVVSGKGTFAEYAKKYSEDKESSVYGGDLGTFYVNQLDQQTQDIVSKLKEGDISFPKRIDYGNDNYGYQIVYLKQRIPEHKATLKTDYTEIKKLADQYKKQKEYQKWIDGLKKTIYWKIYL